MGALKTRLTQALQLAGVNPAQIRNIVTGLPRYLRDARAYARVRKGRGHFPLEVSSLYPIVWDFGDSAGIANGHYFHQDLWAARAIFARRPVKHIDVGSRIDGFIAHLLVFMPVDVIDIRPLESKLPGLTFTQEDATAMAKFAPQSVDSLSSLHAVEHFGLGRYGDPIDPLGWQKAMRSLARVLAPGGRLYFSVPVGRERLVFNAHRIFSPRTVLSTFEDAGLRLASFSAVDDAGDLVSDADPAHFEHARHACGLFELTR
jgi:SAM-dependent methyltransferase